MNKMPSPIFITGCARSGTSMTAGIVAKCGAFGGRTSGPTKYNAKGMYENGVIREDIIKPYLTLLGADPKGQKPLPDVRSLFPVKGLRTKIENLMRGEGYESGPWYYKGAKMCLIWPTLHEAFPDAKWIIVRRETDQIIESCMATAFMNAYRDRDGWRGWVEHHLQRFEEMKAEIHGLDVREIWPTNHVDGNFNEMRAVVRWLGLQWNEEAVLDFVSPELWTRRKVANG